MSDESLTERADAETTERTVPVVADDVLLAAADVARSALREITSPASIGAPAGHIVEGERVLSLLFENRLPGYPGWYWTVSLSREADSPEINVLEAELMPGDGALLAPDWVPWADRLAEYQAQKRAEREAAAAAGEPEPDDDFVVDDEDGDDDAEDVDDTDEELDEDASVVDVDVDDDDDDDDFEDDLDLDLDPDDDDDDDDDFDEAEDLQGAEAAALNSDED